MPNTNKTQKPVFVALGDVHLCDTLWRSRQDVTGDAVLGLKNLYDQAKLLGVPAVIVGDLFDSAEQRDPRSLVQFLRLTDEMESLGLPVYAIQGNHDKRQIPWYAAHEHVRHIGDGKPLQIGDLTCAGLDYAIHDQIQSNLKSVPHVDVLFLHQAVKQALRFEGAWNCDLLDVPPTIPLVVMGDIHSEWESNFREGQTALYTGSGHPRSVSEFGERSITCVHADLTFTRLPVKTRPMKAWKWLTSTPAQVREWLAGLQNPVLPPFVHLTYTESAETEIVDFKAECAKLFDGVLFGTTCLPEIVGHEREIVTTASVEVPTPREILERSGLKDKSLALALDLVTAKQPMVDVLLSHRSNFYA